VSYIYKTESGRYEGGGSVQSCNVVQRDAQPPSPNIYEAEPARIRFESLLWLLIGESRMRVWVWFEKQKSHSRRRCWNEHLFDGR
jgi:hypothetical protein